MGVGRTAGRVGYEEITLPTTCAVAGTSACTMESFSARAKIRSAKRCVFRPVWPCTSFLRARGEQTHELWHPVKNRSCVVDWLDARASPPLALRERRPHAAL